MKQTPDELISDLREQALSLHVDVHREMKLEELLEWEAADFIAAAALILEAVAEAGGPLSSKARILLEGEYLTLPEALYGPD